MDPGTGICSTTGVAMGVSSERYWPKVESRQLPIHPSFIPKLDPEISVKLSPIPQWASTVEYTIVCSSSYFANWFIKCVSDTWSAASSPRRLPAASNVTNPIRGLHHGSYSTGTSGSSLERINDNSSAMVQGKPTPGECWFGHNSGGQTWRINGPRVMYMCSPLTRQGQNIP
jgi:hypothetical protein